MLLLIECTEYIWTHIQCIFEPYWFHFWTNMSLKFSFISHVVLRFINNVLYYIIIFINFFLDITSLMFSNNFKTTASNTYYAFIPFSWISSKIIVLIATHYMSDFIKENWIFGWLEHLHMYVRYLNDSLLSWYIFFIYSYFILFIIFFLWIEKKYSDESMSRS